MNIDWLGSVIGWFPIVLVGLPLGIFGGIAGRVLSSAPERARLLPALRGAYWALLAVSGLVLLFGLLALLFRERFAGSFVLAGASGIASLAWTGVLLFRIRSPQKA